MDKKGNPNSELSLEGGLGVLQPRRNLGFQKRGQKEKYTDYCPILVVSFKMINYPTVLKTTESYSLGTLDSRIDVGQGINIGHGKFNKKNKYRALNKRWAWKIWQKFEVFCNEKTEKIISPINF